MIAGDYRERKRVNRKGKIVIDKIVTSASGTEYVIGPKMGQGGVARVFRCRREKDKKEFAFKEYVPSEEKMKLHPLIMECYYITGDFDYMVRAVAQSAGELTKVLNDIKEIPGVSLTRTYVVLSGVKNTRTMQPGDYLL